MLKIVKIGGNVVDDPDKLQSFLAGFASLEGGKVLVHGGGKVATAIAAALGIETKMVNGRRVTDRRTLEVVTMVYNVINKQITAALNGLGCNAVGLCGADGQFIVSEKRAPGPVDYGFVGDPVAVNTTLARQLAGAGYTIVAAPITYDGKGGLLNTNADTVAQAIATAMAEAGEVVELVFCFEKQGVMLDVNDENSLIPRIDETGFVRLKNEGIVDGGMLPKLENAFRAIDSRVKSVVICSADNIAKSGYGGTTITK